MPFLDEFENDDLLKVAKEKRPNVKRWVGVKSGSSKRRYVCYVCGAEIDQESAKYTPTKHAADAIREHATKHIH